MTIDKPEPKLNPEGYENTFVNTKKSLPDLSKGFSDFFYLVGSARRVWSRSTKNINARITI